MWADLYDILIGMQISINTNDNPTDEHKELSLKIIKLIFSTIAVKPDRLKQLDVDKEFLDSLDLPRLLKSPNEEERELSLNFCIILLNEEAQVTLSDLVEYDMTTRDILTKGQMKRMWETIRHLAKQVGSDAVEEVLG